jgi:general secretion pathway protein C
MNITTRLLQWRDIPPERWAKTTNRYLPQVACGLLVLILAHELTQLTWALLRIGSPNTHQPMANTPPILITSPVQIQNTADANQIVERHLFGQTTEEFEASIQGVVYPAADNLLDVPDTSLSLQLKGVAADPLDRTRGAAIIADGTGTEKTYTATDAIDNGDGAQLHSIYADRVLLNRGGRLESLRLPKQDLESTMLMTKRPTISTPPQQTTQMVLTDNATRFREVMRVAPHIEQSQMVGFRINPGSEQAQFDALGLQPGDVITEINGTAMTDPTRGLQVFESLGQSTQASVTIIRNGLLEVLTIDTSQLSQLP